MTNMKVLSIKEKAEMTDMKEKVPVEFYNLKKAGKRCHPRARTVGQLVKILERLPRSLSIESTWGDGVEDVVYNISYPSVHLRLKDIDND